MFKEWVLADYGSNHEDWNKRRDEIWQLETIAERFSDARHTINSDYIKDWKNKDAKLITKLLKPEYKDINFKLNFFSLIFNSKIISKLKSLNSKKDCCYSYILTGKVIGANWEKDVPENIKSFKKLISVKDKKKELFVSNFGVGNYGLDQAYLKFKTINKKRENKIVIFGFVPETICRIQSSWKNYTEFGNIHGFKPSVELKNGNINFRKNFLKKKHNFSNLKTVIKNINKYDRFYKEKFLKYNFSFPYVLSFAKNFIFNFQIFKKVLVSKKNQVLLEEEIFPIIMKNNIKLSHSLYNENYSKKLMQTLISHISNDLKKQKLICYFVVFPQLFDLKLDTRNNYQNFFRNIKNKNIIDLTTLFLKSKNFKNLYTNDKYGGHLSNKGNDLVAKILNNIINKNK